MIKSSNAVLALWNGTTAEPGEYNTWHTQEHVLERLTVPGFLSARRYVRERGSLPEYFTMYWLAESGPLRSRDYFKLLESPSGQSERMRNGLTDVLRKVCVDVSYSGRGIGGAAAIKLLTFSPAIIPRLRAFWDRQQGQAITSLTFGVFEMGITDLPFKTDSYLLPDTTNSFLLVEGFDSAMLAGNLEAMDQFLHESLGSVTQWTNYRLAFVVGNEDALATSNHPGACLDLIHS